MWLCSLRHRLGSRGTPNTKTQPPTNTNSGRTLSAISLVHLCVSVTGPTFTQCEQCIFGRSVCATIAVYFRTARYARSNGGIPAKSELGRSKHTTREWPRNHEWRLDVVSAGARWRAGGAVEAELQPAAANVKWQSIHQATPRCLPDCGKGGNI